ncbi:MAG: molybdopterin-guanine dinucleotide biosynthesis protein B [Chloroflexi bacterium]|nr:molybdopterin-guanine dinucleotide biosynthesis protein B [Chloroflexota bacterium]
MPAVVCFVGRSKAGKTTLLERLLPEMARRGYRVVAVKHTPHAHELDAVGKDSWRLRQAGAAVTVACTPEQVVEVRTTVRPTSLEDLVARYGEYDLLLAEGFMQSPHPKVEVLRHAVGLELRAPEGERIAIVSDAPVVASCHRFSFDETTALADFLEETQIKPARQETLVTLTVDGSAVGLNPFARSLFANILLAMVAPLKGIGQPERVTLSVQLAPRS